MSDIDPRVRKLLEDIHTSAKRIMTRLRDETREGFLSANGMDAQDIAARRLTIIGEASAVWRNQPLQKNLWEAFSLSTHGGIKSNQ